MPLAIRLRVPNFHRLSFSLLLLFALCRTVQATETKKECVLALKSPAQIESELNQAIEREAVTDSRALARDIRSLANAYLKSKSTSDPLVLKAFARARELDNLPVQARRHYEPTSKPIVAMAIAPWQIGNLNHVVASAAVEVFEIVRQPNHPEAYLTVVDIELRPGYARKVSSSNTLIMPEPTAFETQAQYETFYDVVLQSKSAWETDIGRLPPAAHRFYFASQTTDGVLQERHPLSFRVNGEFRSFLDYLTSIPGNPDEMLLHPVFAANRLDVREP